MPHISIYIHVIFIASFAVVYDLPEPQSPISHNQLKSTVMNSSSIDGRSFFVSTITTLEHNYCRNITCSVSAGIVRAKLVNLEQSLQ